MKVAILGAGNVATHISKALKNSGHSLVQIWSRDYKKGIALASEVGASAILNIEDLNKDVDFVIIAVTDDAIANVASKIPVSASKIIVHTSGSTDLSVLNIHQNFGVLYPLQTFSKDVSLDFSKVPLFVEGINEETQNKILNLAYKLSESVELANSVKRQTLHVSAVFACNFTNYLFTVSQELLEKSGLSFDLLRPLILETIEKTSTKLPVDLQTGPAKRNDRLIINKHLEMLASYPEWQQVYRLISQNIVKST